MQTSTSYKEFLKSAEWRAIRKKRIAHDGGRCLLCRSPNKLEVHHLTYRRAGGRESIRDLVTLCERCHAKQHNRRK
jgi:5-methylcytosine-specific restriction endonuclease McrA